MKQIISVILLLFLGFIPHASAYEVYYPEPLNPPRLVNDFAGVLKDGQWQNLEERLEGYNNSSSIEIAIVLVDTLYGMEVAPYAFELGNRWGIGKRQKDNGVLILASIQDRKMFIATGYGMEGVLTDAVCARIYRNEMVPYFREEQYYQGLTNAVEAILNASYGSYIAEYEYLDPPYLSGSDWLNIIMAILLIIFILIIYKFRNVKVSRGPFIGGGFSSRSGGSRSSGSSSGSGGWGGSGGGGFGGFGGGRFGGGGAGGSW